MIGSDTRLPPSLQDIAAELWDIAKDSGLDMFTTIFEMVDYQQLNEVAAYGGFPTRYPHWRWGMEYERLSKSYTYGLSIIYEMVINNDPCYAYLLRANSEVFQKTVIAHVYGHCDFFKNNFWFSKTNRKMLDQMANHGSDVRRIINDVSQEEVENFIDVCLSLENLIDIQSPFQAKSKALTEDEINDLAKKNVSKLDSKKYMDSYVNPEEFLLKQKEKLRSEAEEAKKIPEKPERDVLNFLLDYAALPSWKRRILEIIRNEAYYFAPQGQTKILNEGWATYWHSKMMTQLSPLGAAEIVDYCDHYAGVVANHQGQLNPYRLGVELLRHVERRWDKGQFGLNWLDCDDPRERREWNTEAGLGKEKLLEIRKIHNDVTFVDEFLDDDFCHASKMFLYDYDKKTNKYVIANRDLKEIKGTLLNQLANFGQPIIEVVDGDLHHRKELLLRHRHQGIDLKDDFARETMKNLYVVWGRTVYLETVSDGTPSRISFDGSSHSVEKI